MDYSNLLIGFFRDYWSCETMLYKDKGFMAYYFEEDSLFVLHFFIDPEDRGLKSVHEMFENIKKIAIKKGKKFIDCSKNMEIKRSNERLLFQLRYGFKIKKIVGNDIYLRYEIK